MKQLKKQGLRRCHICKNIKSLEDFVKNRSASLGYAYRCKECEKERGKQRRKNNPEYFKNQKENWRQTHKENYKKYRNTIKSKYLSYKNNARIRNHNFDLTVEQFKTFWQKPCMYCGAKIKTVGIDRIDNNIGYKIDNCVSCCKICNKMKSNTNIKKFIKHCKKISSLRPAFSL